MVALVHLLGERLDRLLVARCLGLAALLAQILHLLVAPDLPKCALVRPPDIRARADRADRLGDHVLVLFGLQLDLCSGVLFGGRETGRAAWRAWLQSLDLLLGLGPSRSRDERG